VLHHRYRNNAIRQGWYNVLLHTKLLGGVSSLVSNIGTGLRDFFTEPVHGLLAGEIVTTFEGIGKGTSSLVQRVV
jgi:hypothetical protein